MCIFVSVLASRRFNAISFVLKKKPNVICIGNVETSMYVEPWVNRATLLILNCNRGETLTINDLFE